jgi:hypothetical protein
LPASRAGHDRPAGWTIVDMSYAASYRRKQKVRRPIGLMIVLVMCSAAAQSAQGQSFESRMYAIARLDHFDTSKLAGLPADEKRDLLACRDAVIRVLKGIETKSDVRPYITPALARKYPRTEALGAALVDPETSLLAAGVSDFDLTIGGEKGIQLKVFAVVFSEGIIAASEKIAYCQRSGARWRISEFE